MLEGRLAIRACPSSIYDDTLKLSMDERKRTRYCSHCKEEVSYAVYKRHKKEFYDARKKEWATCHVTSADVHIKELDAADDLKICNALASAHKGISPFLGQWPSLPKVVVMLLATFLLFCTLYII